MTGEALRGAACAWALAFSGCAPHPVVVRRWPVMATYATATIVTRDPRGGASAIERVRRSFERVNDTMSNWSEASELQRLNAAARTGAAPITDPDLAGCIAAALDAAVRTRGAFDPTVGPLMTLWGFRPQAPRVPAEEEIAETLRHVGASKVAFDRAAGTIRFSDDGMELDLGGIAKGCALDLARREAVGVSGLEGGLLDLGGQLASWGRSPDGPAWAVGIRDPEGVASILATLVLRPGGTAASSSDVEQGFVAAGRRYGHIMDALSGAPAITDVLQSTAIDPSATIGDVLSTALFVTGSARAAETLRAYPSAEAVLIVRDRGALALLASSSLRGRLTIEETARERFTSDSPRFVLPAATMSPSANP